MMFFQDHHFPQLARLIRVRLPALEQTSPKVFEALAQTCAGKEQVRQALRPGTYPRVHVDDWGNKNVRGVFIGDCRVSEENRINVLAEVASGFDDTPDEVSASAMEALVLHEMVHWARFQAKLPPRIGGEEGDPGSGKEAGDEFERLAYGRTGNHWGKECTDWKPKPIGTMRRVPGAY